MVGKVAVRLKMPDVWSKLHPVFHVALVRRYFPDTKVVYLPPPSALHDADEGEPDPVVNAILGHRGGSKRTMKYLVSFKGFGPEYNQHLPRSKLSQYQSLLDAYRCSAGLDT
jgi:hypothetical protein